MTEFKKTVEMGIRKSAVFGMTDLRKQLVRFIPGIIILVFLAVAPPLVGTAITSLINKILVFALIAMGLDIAFGYTGLWSFGHAAIAGAASYTVAIFIKQSVTNFWAIGAAGIFTAVVVSAVMGVIALRTAGVYFLLITFALGQLVYSVVYKLRITGGSDGLGGVPYPDIAGITFSSQSFYYMSLIVFVIAGLLMYRLIKSPFGYSLQGIRENETRMRTLGYNTWLHKWMAFIISGLFAGVGGVLYVYYQGLIAPAAVGLDASGLVMIMIIIGGGGTLWGALVGSTIIFLIQYYISILSPERWPIFLGVVFILAVLLAGGGIFQKLAGLWRKATERGRT